MKRLYLLRHAKSSWDEPQLADHERPLAPRGRRAAELLARHLHRERIAPALVLCSSARRSRATLEAIAPALDEAPPAEIERGLYQASDGELLERLNAVPDSVESVLLIGHNPAVQQLALNLADSGAARARVERKYPTGAMAVLTFSGRWSELGPGGARLVSFIRPKALG